MHRFDSLITSITNSLASMTPSTPNVFKGDTGATFMAQNTPSQSSSSLERGTWTPQSKQPQEALPAATTPTTAEKDIVTWEGDADPADPKNWSSRRKWCALFTVSCFAFISPVSTSMIAPSLPLIAARFNISSDIESQLTLSVFILAYAVGPMFLGPLSEMYGRVPVLQLANLIYLVFNTGCGFAQNKGQMLAFRFLSGLGGSAPLAIAGGVVTDLFDAHERGKAVSIYTLAPLLGPAIGPIMGGFITESISWRWVFWVTSIADVVIQIAGFIFLQETCAPVLLERKCNAMRKKSNNPRLRTVYQAAETMNLRKKLSTNLVRPFRMIATQPIVQFLSVYMAYLYGLLYIVLSTFPTLWTQRYHQRLGVGALHYIALGLGFFLAAQIVPRVGDRIYCRLRDANGGFARAEFRVPPMFGGSILVPIGLFIYGFTAQAHTHWIGPDIGIFIFALGVIVCFQCAQIYLVDAYTRYAASALGAVNTLRSLAGFGFPLFAPKMYQALGWGWGNGLLAFAAIGLGIPATWTLWRCGERLRGLSQFAAS